MKKQYNKDGQKQPGSSTNVRKSDRNMKKKGEAAVPIKEADKKRASPSMKLKIRKNKAGVKMSACSKATEDRGKQVVSDMPPVMNATSTEIPAIDVTPATFVGFSKQSSKFRSRSIPQCKFVPDYFFEHGDISWASHLKRDNMWPFFNLQEKVYPELVREFYSNLMISEEDPSCAVSTVKFKKIYVTVEKLAEILNVPAEGSNVVSLSKSEQEEAYKQAIEYAHVKGSGRTTLNKNADLSADNRLLHYIISYMVLPRSGGYDCVHKNDIILIVDILKGKSINLPGIVFSEIVRSVKTPLLFSPYGSILTRVCRHFGVKMDYGEFCDTSEICLKTLKLMKIQFDPLTKKLVRVKEPAPSRSASSNVDDMLSRQKEMESKIDELVEKTALRDEVLDAREKRLDQREEKMDAREKRLDRREEKLDLREKRLNVRAEKLEHKELDVNIREEAYIRDTEAKLDKLIALVQENLGEPSGDDKSAEMAEEDDGNSAQQGEPLGEEKNVDEETRAGR